MRAIKIGVGYGWSDSPAHEDVRWSELRNFCRAVAEQGRKMAAAALALGVTDEDQESQTDGLAGALPRVSVARLRASVGQFTWDSVRQHIDDSDIVIFDLTPTKKFQDQHLYVSDNIWIEIGYALSDRRRFVFLVHREKNGHEFLPSDLRGLMVGCIPAKSAKNHDASLRLGVAGAVRRLVLERTEEDLAVEIKEATPITKEPRKKMARNTRLSKL